jgi:preprotein translocase subunit SecG
MKNIKKLLLGILLLVLPITVNAASASIKVTGASTAIVGNNVSITVTLSSSTAIGSWKIGLNYDKSYLSLVSSSAEAGGTIMANSSSGTKSKSYTYVFKALKSGSTTISISSYDVYAYSDLSEMSISVSNKSLKLMTQAELEATYSKDNNLKSLGVDGYTLTPEFSKDVTEYSVTVPSDVTSVNISATKNDSTASLTGDGEKEVIEGQNTFEIVVTAQNGSTKTYTIMVEVEDLNPIEVNINNENYTIVKRKDVLTKPSTYEEKTITINNTEVPAFYSESTKFTLVGIKDTAGNVYLAIYNESDNSYTKYNEITTNNLNLYLKEFPSNIDGYIKDTININDVDVEVYRYKDNSRFVICYGMNIETGEYDYYSYDTLEKTFQVWNNEEVLELKTEVKNYLYCIIAFGSGLFVAFILIICLLKKKKTKKHNHKEEKEMKLKETKKDKEAKTKEEEKKDDSPLEKVIENDEDMHDLIKDMKQKKKERNKKNK